MVERLHYRRHNHYNTESNKVKIVKTPGGRLIYHTRKKSAQRPKCGDCRRPLPGLPAKRPHEYRWLKRHERTISRAYGGSRCHKCVKERIIRAFLLEEQKCVKQVLLEREKRKKEEKKQEVKLKTKKNTNNNKTKDTSKGEKR